MAQPAGISIAPGQGNECLPGGRLGQFIVSAGRYVPDLRPAQGRPIGTEPARIAVPAVDGRENRSPWGGGSNEDNPESVTGRQQTGVPSSRRP